MKVMTASISLSRKRSRVLGLSSRRSRSPYRKSARSPSNGFVRHVQTIESGLQGTQ